MGRKEITTKEDLMKVIELFENTGITYWLDYTLSLHDALPIDRKSVV